MADESPNTEYIKDTLGEKFLESQAFRGDETVIIRRDGLRETFRLLKGEPRLDFDFLADITAVDYLGKKPVRFELVYQLLSLKAKHRLRVKVPVPDDDPRVESLTPLWPGANWLEREVWDMFGIRFEGHPDLRRILLYEEFQGHPLRKDYPVNLCQPRVPERKVEGTFVDQRSQNKLLRLKQKFGVQS